MRVFLFKVKPKRWTLYIEKSEYFSKGIDIENGSELQQQQSGFTKILGKIKTTAIESREEIENATYGVGLKGKLKTVLHSLENRIHPEESILHQFSKLTDKNIMLPSNHHHHHNNHHHTTKEIFQDIHDKHERPSFTIHYPSEIGARRAQRYSQIFIQQRISYHKIWMIINMILIPFTTAATILPGPNIFLGYNLYRLYGHYQALKGCSNFQKYTKSHGHLLYKPSLEISECLSENSNNIIQIESNNTAITENQPLLEKTNNNNTNNIYSMNFDRLSTNLKIPGLFDFIKKIENTEK